MIAVRTQSRRALAGQSLLLLGIIVSVFALAGIGGADTSGNPDTNTRADWDPAQVDANTGQTPGATLTGAVEGRVLKVHVDGVAGKFFGVNQARLCRSGLSITTASQMSPSAFGDCIPKPFQGSADDDPNRQDDSYVNAPADQSNTFVDFTFRVGSGTQTFNDSGGSPHTITCDSSNPCSLWLQESVSTTIKSGGNIYKHYDIQYAAAGSTTTTAPTGTTTTTAPSGTTTSTAPTGTTTTTAPTGTTTSTAPSGTTTTTAPGGTTTTTAPTGTTTSTAPTGTTTTTAPTGTTTTTARATTTTAPSGTTTSTAPSGTTTTTTPATATTTTAPSGTTTSTAPGDTTTSTAPSGVSVSPSSAPPGGAITITSTGWKPCSAEPTSTTVSSTTSTTVSSTTSTTAGSTTSTTACPPVTVVIQSDPITLGSLTPDSAGTVTGQFTIPASVPAGSHTLVLSGTGADGTARTVSVPFTVTSGSANGATGGSLAPAAGSGASGLAATGTRLKMLWFGLVLCGAGGLLILSARRRARPLS